MAFYREYDQYIIENDKKFPALKRVRCNGSGSVPKPLRGIYTTALEAINAIDAHKLKTKVARNGNKTKPASGSEQLQAGPDNGSESAGVSG